MKNIFSTLFLFLLVTLQVSAQTKVVVPNKVYDEMKADGTLKPGVNYMIVNDSKPEINKLPAAASEQKKNKENNRTLSACSCLVPVDATFNVAEFTSASAPDYRNDDGSTLAKTLPFTFCFYGTNYNSVYINNNGNITFVPLPPPGYTTNSFPAGLDTVMIAPFWADVDTRDAGSGLVYYKITSTYMIVKWDRVGYFSNHSDKLNDFQLIISDGNDPIIPNGNNVAFCYGDMQWTTGDASGGTNGFGSGAATAGINAGDGDTTHYFPLGRFNQNNSAYDGPYNNDDGINYLDNKSYYFSTCAPGNNIPPVLTPYLSVCDSFKICGPADTLIYPLTFSSPELGQNVSSITASAPTLGSAFTVLSVTTGQTGTILVRIIANAGLAGNHVITITATDDGTPAASSIITFNVPIILGASPPDPIISASPPSICAGIPSTLTLTTPTLYDSYLWSNGVTSGAITVSDGNEYAVTVYKNGCYKSTSIRLHVGPLPTPTILSSSTPYCSSTPMVLSLDSVDLYPTISWSNGSTGDTVQAWTGTFAATVTDTNGCTSTSPPATSDVHPIPIIGISSDISIFLGSSTSVFANGGTNYNWSPATGLSCTACDSTIASPTETQRYCVTVASSFGCIDSSCVNVDVEIYCPSNRDLTIPNAFTPNGDGYNDELCLYGWDFCVSKFEINIFDRLGENVFTSKDPAFCWNGVYKGEALDPAVFVYFIKATFVASGAAASDPQKSTEITKKGNISLVR